MNSKPLASPGAGLPYIERQLLCLGVKNYAFWASKSVALKRFRQQGELLLQWATALSPKQGQQPVLIKRVAAIEDSSRFWSIFMVLEHLVIVNDFFGKTIASLSQEKPFDRPLHIAEVKPNEKAGQEQIKAFQNSIAVYTSLINDLTHLHSKTCHFHPWFGFLNAHGWHGLTALHQTVHRRQVGQILKQLSL